LAGQKNFYEILGVPRDASFEIIKKAFRKLAHQHHPDKNPGAGAVAMFKEISLAYKTLTNPASRMEYDLEIEDTQPQARHRAPAKAAAKPSRSAPGKNLLYHLAITLEEGFNGTTKTIRYMRTINGTRQTSSVDVQIPPGMRPEKKLRVRGAGESLSPHLTPGDLVVVIHIQPHIFFSLDESDVILTMPISPLDLLPIGPMLLPSLHGPVAIAQVPIDEFQHPTLKLKDRGYPLSESSHKYGDMIVRFVIEVPPMIEENLKDKLRQIKKSLPKTARQQELEKFSRS
jgi:molecular chaperone DnaJ